MNILLSSAYLAPVQYYSKFLMGKSIIIEQYDTYIKQTYRNRCVINATDGAMPLSIPVIYSAKERTKVKDVLISEHDNWQHTHWNAIVSAYNSTPFFEYYADDYEKFYLNKYDSLLHFNDELLHLTLSHLNVEIPKIEYSQSYIEIGGSDYRELIHPKRRWEEDSHFHPEIYYQVFQDKHGFLPNMSILDLLFNMGNESIFVLQKSII